MTRHKLIAILAIALGAMATTAPLRAMTNDHDRDWPSVVVSPILDVPMRDTAITRGPDGIYYLTGTLGVLKKGEGCDFDNNQVIKIWKSKDLKKWVEMGVVWSLQEDVLGAKGDINYKTKTWMRASHKDPASEDSPVVRGIKAPELHAIQGNWHICFSMNNQGTGLLKSASGKPEGPYESVGQITLDYGDPSMFEDDDGKVYWLFGGGWIAPMNKEMRGLAEKPRLLQPETQTSADWTGLTRNDYPLTMGDHGVFLFKHCGRYYLTSAERNNRLNASCDDTLVAVSDNLMGPYGQRHLMVPHGGGITVFRGPRSSAVPNYYYPQQDYFRQSVSQYSKPLAEIEKGKTEDTLYATFFGNDNRAIFRDRPAFLPLEWVGPQNCYGFMTPFVDCKSTPRKPYHVSTERGPWPYMKQLIPGETIRDMNLTVAPDGFYYWSGSVISHPGKLYFWRSKDLAKWERIGPLWTYEQIEWLDKTPYEIQKYAGAHDDEHIFWHSWMTPWKGTYYIQFAIFSRKDLGKVSVRDCGTGALKSVTGKAEGPYVSIGRVGGQFGQPGPVYHAPFFQHEGRLYASDHMNYKNAVALADLDSPQWKFDWKRVDDGVYPGMQRGDLSYVASVGGKPILCFRSSGRNSDRQLRTVDSYDVNYIVMDSPWGPPRSDCKSRCIPHCALANIFQDRKGYWWSSMFGSDTSAPWEDRFGLQALKVEPLGKHDLLIDVEDHPNDYQKKIMGGGQIAEVKTVQETLK